MKPEFSQKTMGLCFVVGLALVMATALVMSFVSGDRGSAPGTINEMIDSPYGPVTDEAVPLPRRWSPPRFRHFLRLFPTTASTRRPATRRSNHPLPETQNAFAASARPAAECRAAVRG